MANKKSIEQYGFDKKTQENAKKYMNANLKFTIIQYAIIAILAIIIMIVGISTGLENFVLQFSSNPWVVVGLYLMIGYICYWLISLPFNYYYEYYIEHKFNLSTQTRKSWMADKVKGLIVYFIFLIIIVELIYFALRTYPAFWWVLAWIFATLFTIMITFIMPIILMPIFFKLKPLKNEELAQRLMALAEKAKTKIVGIYEIKMGVKTKKAYGALTGLSKTRRIIISDTLIDKYSNDEIENVLAHEFGHHNRKHVGISIITESILYFVCFFFVDLILKNTINYFEVGGLADIASIPLFALIFGAFYIGITPLINTLMRKLERQADQYALELADKPDAFISVMVKIHDQNLGDADPHPLVEYLTHNHPSGKKRVQMALKYKDARRNVSSRQGI